ncbi:MAG: hypothetical protein J6X62_01575 [Bacteroidales bacterium]|nr:hypothetical protein [Bacteroidales bacterium]
MGAHIAAMAVHHPVAVDARPVALLLVGHHVAVDVLPLVVEIVRHHAVAVVLHHAVAVVRQGVPLHVEADVPVVAVVGAHHHAVAVVRQGVLLPAEVDVLATVPALVLQIVPKIVLLAVQVLAERHALIPLVLVTAQEDAMVNVQVHVDMGAEGRVPIVAVDATTLVTAGAWVGATTCAQINLSK